MKVQFKNEKITDGENVWLVSGYWDTKTSHYQVSRIEGHVSDDGIKAALFNLAIDKGWL